MNEHFLESDTKDSVMSEENAVHQQSHLETLIELNTQIIGRMAQMLDCMKVE